MSIKIRATLILSTTLLLPACFSDPEIKAGEEVFNQVCKVCHLPGLNGAPILGNEKMWAPRKDQPLDVLVSHATNGFGLMPAKGGNEDLTEDQIRSAIKYMLSQLED